LKTAKSFGYELLGPGLALYFNAKARMERGALLRVIGFSGTAVERDGPSNVARSGNGRFPPSNASRSGPR